MIRAEWVVSPQYKESYMEVLSENLSALRAKVGITQEELANLIGISRQTYYAFETKKRDLSWNTYLALIFFFDTNVNTHTMLRDINAYPLELIIRMNGTVTK